MRGVPLLDGPPLVPPHQQLVVMGLVAMGCRLLRIHDGERVRDGHVVTLLSGKVPGGGGRGGEDGHVVTILSSKIPVCRRE